MKIMAIVMAFLLMSCGEEDNVPDDASADCWLTRYEDNNHAFTLKYDGQHRIIRTENYNESDELRSEFNIDYSRVDNGLINVEKNSYDGTKASLIIKIENSLPVEYDLNESDKAILSYDSEGLLKYVTFQESYYEFIYDSQKRNIVRITRFAQNIKTGTLTIRYDDKINPVRNLWVLAASTGFGYFDDFHIYFSENNPVEYSYEDSGAEDFEDILTYEYENSLPMSNSTNSLRDGKYSINSGIYGYTCN